jgi:hypothetical protein
MSLFTPRPPVDEDEREWIENSMMRLGDLFGFEKLRTRQTILPTPAFFPIRYTATEEGLDEVAKKVCEYMDVDFSAIDLWLFSDHNDFLKAHLAQWQSSHSGAAGLYSPTGDQKFRIAIEMKLLEQPGKLVATIAHELGHVLLLGSGKIQRTEEDHEYLTDLLTVYLGLGLFTANAAFTFSQWQDGQRQGWSASRQGYMSEPMFGYALAAYCWMRGEQRPAWEPLMVTNIRDAFRRSMKFLRKTGRTRLPKG